jgi:hypothetical protein
LLSVDRRRVLQTFEASLESSLGGTSSAAGGKPLFEDSWTDPWLIFDGGVTLGLKGRLDVFKSRYIGCDHDEACG